MMVCAAGLSTAMLAVRNSAASHLLWREARRLASMMQGLRHSQSRTPAWKSTQVSFSRNIKHHLHIICTKLTRLC